MRPILRRYGWNYATVVCGVLACVAAAASLGWRVAPVAAAGQKSDELKAVDLDYAITPVDAVRITKITVAGREIQTGRSVGAREDKAGTPFQADANWISNTSIFLKNRTDQVIVCAEVEAVFPDTGDGSQGHPVTIYTITVGQPPEWSLYARNGAKMTLPPAKTPLFLGPGTSVEIHVGDYVDEMQAVVEERMLFSKVTRVDFSRGNVYFANGMMWANGAYFAPEYGHPGHWTRLARNYFPGRPAQNP